MKANISSAEFRESEFLREKNLWQACIRQYIEDLLSSSSDKKSIKADAFNFFFAKDNDSCRLICVAAGYNFISLVDKVRRLYEYKIKHQESLYRKVFKDYGRKV